MQDLSLGLAQSGQPKAKMSKKNLNSKVKMLKLIPTITQNAQKYFKP
jgi:hypothetical protein